MIGACRNWICSLLVPAGLAGTGGGLAWWLSQSPGMAAGVAGGMLATSAWHLYQVHRDRQATLNRLRNPDQRDTDSGIFQPVLEELSTRLARHDAMMRQAQQSRVEVEARGHIRHKHAQRLETVLQSLPEPVFVFDPGMRLVFSNTAASALIRESGGGNTNDWSSLPELNTLLDMSRWKAQRQRTRSVEFTRPAGNRKRSYRATAFLLRDDDDIAAGLATVIRDISQDNEQKSRHAEFVSSVCHELKTPMASIKAFVEMLMDGEAASEEEHQRLLGFIDVQVDRLTRLVNNMLNLARIESGVIQVKRDNTALNEFLTKSLEVVQPMADEKTITVTDELSDLYIGVHVDRDLLAQAVINLLSNAIKYTPSGGHIWLRSRQEDGEALIDVQDDGMGIPDEDQKRVFQRFYRVERNSQAAPGTGLGLALVQYIVQDIHGGRVLLRSRVGEGSCFTIVLPLGHRGAGKRPVGTATWMMQ